ncbi:hypothetical protein JXO59_14610 [candidate division KSB1 bacterium]|nr:hypothetical protein [candidate division KSB1 bacterium]
MRQALFILLIATWPVVAQQETLIGGESHSGGYGGPLLQITEMKGHSATLVGGRGGWIINHSFVLGGAAYGLVTNIESDADVLAQEGNQYSQLFLNVGMAGVMLEYYARPQKLIHFSIQVVIGAGTVGYCTHRKGEGHWYEDEEDNLVAEDAFFFAEPGITATLNVASFMRLGVGASYRTATGVGLEGLKDDDLSGIGMNVFLNFGSF